MPAHAIIVYQQFVCRRNAVCARIGRGLVLEGDYCSGILPMIETTLKTYDGGFWFWVVWLEQTGFLFFGGLLFVSFSFVMQF